MGKHSAPRTRPTLSARTAGVIALGAVGGILTAALVAAAPQPEPVQGQAHASVIQEDDPSWDCRTMGNRVCGPSYDLTHEDTDDYTCWLEKASDPTTAEGICGARGQRPAGSVEIGQEVTIGGHQWVATLNGLEPVSAN